MNGPKEGDMLSGFRLQSAAGETLGPQDYKEKKNLVVVFFDPRCAPCTDFLSDMAARYEDYTEMDAEVLAVGGGSLDEVREVAASRGLPYPVLADPDGHVRSRYSGVVPAVFVADRFGEIRLVRAEDGEHLPDQTAILDRLALIELECPECGVPTWGAASNEE